MAIEVRDLDKVVVVIVKNDLGNEQTAEFRSIMREVTDRPLSPHVILDLGLVHTICSSALAVVGVVYKLTKQKGGSVRVVNLQDRVRRLFHTTQILTLLPEYETVDEAIKAATKPAG